MEWLTADGKREVRKRIEEAKYTLHDEQKRENNVECIRQKAILDTLRSILRE